MKKSDTKEQPARPVSVAALNEGIHIPPKLCELKPSAFDGIYEARIRTGQGYQDAYEMIEQAHARFFGSRKYSSYHSYRNSRKRRIQGHD